jgi:exodeoxyribonuclease-3
MKIATWNVNSVNARLPTVLEVLKTCDADVWCLQEIKCIDEKFPREEIEALGFNCAVFGQKTYNGVAVLSKHRISDEVRHLARRAGRRTEPLSRSAGRSPAPCPRRLCLPAQRQSAPGDKYDYKLRWMDRLIQRANGSARNGRSRRSRWRLQLHPAR